MEKSKKIILIALSFCLLFLSIVGFIPSTNAATTMYITGDLVRLRTGPGTENKAIIELNKGYKITLNSDTPTNKSASCTNGWYEVTYNDMKGFVCANYVSKTNPLGNNEVNGLKYSLPWTSPKKAIIGGAEWISDGYISQGQNTSYLKKFNVTPDDPTPYDHQYMANVEAPFSESLTTYNSYKKNNLLSLPLHFLIPIFNDMPEYTTHPVKGKKTGGQTVVKDKKFEEQLDKEGFPESYKVWLRKLHETYPNWTFGTLKTNLDFNASVNAEQTVCSISIASCEKCLTKKREETESGWYKATKETIAYYLDPRNFLEAERIMMFEYLGYNEMYTEKVVQSVLSGTFMDGKDPIDKVNYSSIFMEAGKTHNINPVYLAALSRQEMGVKGGITSSGERFEYKGITYEGFYNFFNIHAYSSEANPAKAGLVYAASGATRNEEGIYVGNFNKSDNNNQTSNEQKLTPVATHLNNMKLNKKGYYVTNISPETTVGSLKNKTISEEVTIKNSTGNTVGNTEKVTTGSKIKFETGEEYTFVIYGDLTGDGNINGADLLKMRQYLLGQISLEGAYLESAHVYTINGNVNGADLLKIRQYLLGKNNINQA